MIGSAGFTELSGGKAFFPTNLDDLDKMLTTVNTELRHQYSIGFSPSAGMDGRWHKLKVKIKDDVRAKMAVHSRQGYQAHQE